MKKLIQILKWTANRLKEPSTQAGLASLAAIAHLNIDPGIMQSSVDIFAASTSLLAIILNEKGT